MENFEDIPLPDTLEQGTYLCCDGDTTKSKKKVRLFYEDGTKSSVEEVEPSVLAEATRMYCVMPAIHRGLLWNFVRVNQIEPLQIALGLQPQKR